MYNQRVCVFDITNSILDAIPCPFALHDFQLISPLKSFQFPESLSPISDSVLKQIDKEYGDYQKGWFPSVLGDSLRLGVLWLMMSSIIEDKDLVERILNVSSSLFV